MKKIWERIKDAWFGALPLLILVGIPTAICIVFVLISIWDDIPEIIDNISTVGNGSLIYGIILIIFGLIGAINAFAAFMLWFKKFTELLDRKAKSYFWFCFYLIVVVFGWYALFKLIEITILKGR